MGKAGSPVPKEEARTLAAALAARFAGDEYLFQVVTLAGLGGARLRRLRERYPNVEDWATLDDVVHMLNLSDTEFAEHFHVALEAKVSEEVAQDSALVCPMCKADTYTNLQIVQVRSGDEDATGFASCSKCKTKWVAT